MKKHSAADAHAKVNDFFATNFPDFSKLQRSGRIAFIREFYQKDLMIIVTTPIICAGTETRWLAKGLHIRFSVHHKIKGECLILKDTVLTRGWEKVAKDKIQTLIDLINDIKKCGRCGVHYYPRWNKETQNNPKGTVHALLTCPKCAHNDMTTFRSKNRLKSRLNSYLPKKER